MLNADSGALESTGNVLSLLWRSCVKPPIPKATSWHIHNSYDVSSQKNGSRTSVKFKTIEEVTYHCDQDLGINTATLV